jgi:catechol 2,3-dioxygenase-like lactoylglutathione lyase family enzyme
MFTVKETNVTIMVNDMDASVNFYEQLGLTVKNRWDNHYAQLAGEGIIVGLHPSHGETKGSGNVSIGFIVDKLDEVQTHLDSKRITYKLSSEDKSGLFAYVQDPDGTEIFFMQPAMSW